MRTVTFKSVADRALQRAGFDPATAPTATKLALGGYIGDALRKCWEWGDFEELCPIEERALRPAWNDTTQYYANYEVYHGGKYYRALATSLGFEPPNDTYWLEISPDPWMAKAQPGVRIMDQVFAVWEDDPRTFDRPPRVPFVDRGEVIWLKNPPATVWVNYRLPVPETSYEPIDAGASYETGAVRYNPADGECYRALQPALGSDIGDPAKWEQQPMPYVLAQPVILFSAASLHAEDGNETKAERMESQAMNALMDAFEVARTQTLATTL